MQKNITFSQFIRRTWWIVVITTGVAVLAAYIFTATAPPVYRVTTRLVVSPDATLVSENDMLRSLDTLDRGSITATYAEIFNSASIAEAARRNAGISAAVFQEYRVNAFRLPETNVLGLSVSGPNPNAALLLVNAITAEGTNYVKELYPVFLVSILDEPGLPTRPVGPNLLRNIVVALLLGIALGSVLGVLRSPGIIRSLDPKPLNVSAASPE